MFLTVALLATTPGAQPEAPKSLVFKDGDRIVWLGNTLVEREQRYGYWETALIAANADKKITVRNLGWSGDTVHGEARGRFDFNNAEKCFKQIVEPTLELKPTVIFICYGTNESFEGKEGLLKFEKGLEKLLDALKPSNARIVLFSPLQFEKSASLPDPAPRNQTLGLYREAIKRVAGTRGHAFADLYQEVGVLTPVTGTAHQPIAENGMHLSDSGYRESATQFLKVLGLSYEITYDRTTYEQLRQVVVAKNEQFFNKWRPQNETYLFGFRKHEQGKNAKEIAEFDPFIEKLETEIDKLRKSLKK
jgi:lysophospholipase L1-like esterase